MIYDIFISYRRDGGFDTAKHLNDLLIHDGYTVSFDIDTLREGDFDKALLERIEQCRDFLVIVDKHAFDRIMNPAPEYDPEKDWMRKEIAYALNLKKNIISVLLAGASYPAKLPVDLDKLDLKNGPTYSKEYFDSFYDKLKKFLHSTPRNKSGSTLINHTNTVLGTANLKVKADLDCVFYLDGEKYMTLRTGKIGKLPLSEGEYFLEFVSIENESDRFETVFTMPDKDIVVLINLTKVRNKRLLLEAGFYKEETRSTFESPYIITDNCVGCSTCIDECPVGAISEGDIFVIDPDTCVACGTCAAVCPAEAIVENHK